MAIRLFLGLALLAVACFCLATAGRHMWRTFVASVQHMSSTSPVERRVILLIVAGLIALAVGRVIVLAWARVMLRG